MLFAKPSTASKNLELVQLFTDPVHWVDTVSYLGVTLDKWLTQLTYVDKVRKRAAQRLRVLGPLLNGRSGLFIRNCSAV